MADRKRSTDGSRDTDLVAQSEGPVGNQGRTGGRLARQIGTRDEERQAVERSTGVTRVRKADKDGGNA